MPYLSGGGDPLKHFDVKHTASLPACEVKATAGCRGTKAYSKFVMPRRISSVNHLKKAIFTGGPVYVGTPVFTGFMQYKGSKAEKSVYCTGSDEVKKGGHAMALFGWGKHEMLNAKGQKVEVPYWWGMNSWGDSWGISHKANVSGKETTFEGKGSFRWCQGYTQSAEIEKDAIFAFPLDSMPREDGADPLEKRMQQVGNLFNGFACAEVLEDTSRHECLVKNTCKDQLREIKLSVSTHDEQCGPWIKTFQLKPDKTATFKDVYDCKIKQDSFLRLYNEQDCPNPFRMFTPEEANRYGKHLPGRKDGKEVDGIYHQDDGSKFCIFMMDKDVAAGARLKCDDSTVWTNPTYKKGEDVTFAGSQDGCLKRRDATGPICEITDWMCEGPMEAERVDEGANPEKHPQVLPDVKPLPDPEPKERPPDPDWKPYDESHEPKDIATACLGFYTPGNWQDADWKLSIKNECKFDIQVTLFFQNTSEVGLPLQSFPAGKGIWVTPFDSYYTQLTDGTRAFVAPGHKDAKLSYSFELTDLRDPQDVFKGLSGDALKAAGNKLKAQWKGEEKCQEARWEAKKKLITCLKETESTRFPYLPAYDATVEGKPGTKYKVELEEYDPTRKVQDCDVKVNFKAKTRDGTFYGPYELDPKGTTAKNIHIIGNGPTLLYGFVDLDDGKKCHEKNWQADPMWRKLGINLA